MEKNYSTHKCSPDHCGLVGWVMFHRVKVHPFDSWSGHMHGFHPQWAKSQPTKVSLSHRCKAPYLSLSLPLSKNTWINI